MMGKTHGDTGTTPQGRGGFPQEGQRDIGISALPQPTLWVTAGCRETCLSHAQHSWVSAGLAEQKWMACKAQQVTVGGKTASSGLEQCDSLSY